jgi:hypothetical protein
MPIDASIVGRLQPMQFQDPVNQLAKVMQIKDMQQNQAVNGMKMDEYRRGVEDQNALRQALSQPGADPYNVLLQRGRVKEAGDYQLNQAKVARENTATDADKLKMAHQRVEMVGQGMGWLRQNPSAENAQMLVQGLVQQGIAPHEMAQQLLAQIQRDPSPQNIARLATMGYQQALQAKDQLPKYETRNTGGTTDTLAIGPVDGKVSVVNSVRNTASPESLLSAETQRRGQNMVDQRSRDQLAQGKWQYDAERGGMVNLQTGEFKPATQNGVPIGQKNKPMNDAQSKANLFGTRMKESDRILSDLEGKYSPVAVNAKMAAGEVPGIGGALGYAGNKMLSDEGQQAEQAQRDFINAALRRESGAVISPSEFSNGQKQYFPQPGDSDAVLKQKRANRQLAIRGLEAEVPGGFRTSPTLTNPGSEGGASGGWSIQKVN